MFDVACFLKNGEMDVVEVEEPDHFLECSVVGELVKDIPLQDGGCGGFICGGGREPLRWVEVGDCGGVEVVRCQVGSCLGSIWGNGSGVGRGVMEPGKRWGGWCPVGLWFCGGGGIEDEVEVCGCGSGNGEVKSGGRNGWRWRPGCEIRGPGAEGGRSVEGGKLGRGVGWCAMMGYCGYCRGSKSW